MDKARNVSSFRILFMRESLSEKTLPLLLGLLVFTGRELTLSLTVWMLCCTCLQSAEECQAFYTGSSTLPAAALTVSERDVPSP